MHGPAESMTSTVKVLAEKVRSARAVVCISDFARSQLMALVDESEWNKLEVSTAGSIRMSLTSVETATKGASTF